MINEYVTSRYPDWLYEAIERGQVRFRRPGAEPGQPDITIFEDGRVIQTGSYGDTIVNDDGHICLRTESA